MIIALAILLGALYGARMAKKRKGNRFDMAQYAFGYAVVFGVVTLLVMIILDRLF